MSHDLFEKNFNEIWGGDFTAKYFFEKNSENNEEVDRRRKKATDSGNVRFSDDRGSSSSVADENERSKKDGSREENKEEKGEDKVNSRFATNDPRMNGIGENIQSSDTVMLRIDDLDDDMITGGEKNCKMGAGRNSISPPPSSLRSSHKNNNNTKKDAVSIVVAEDAASKREKTNNSSSSVNSEMLVSSRVSAKNSSSSSNFPLPTEKIVTARSTSNSPRSTTTPRNSSNNNSGGGATFSLLDTLDINNLTSTVRPSNNNVEKRITPDKSSTGRAPFARRFYSDGEEEDENRDVAAARGGGETKRTERKKASTFSGASSERRRKGENVIINNITNLEDDDDDDDRRSVGAAGASLSLPTVEQTPRSLSSDTESNPVSRSKRITSLPTTTSSSMNDNSKSSAAEGIVRRHPPRIRTSRFYSSSDEERLSPGGTSPLSSRNSSPTPFAAAIAAATAIGSFPSPTASLPAPPSLPPVSPSSTTKTRKPTTTIDFPFPPRSRASSAQSPSPTVSPQTIGEGNSSNTPRLVPHPPPSPNNISPTYQRSPFPPASPASSHSPRMLHGWISGKSIDSGGGGGKAPRSTSPVQPPLSPATSAINNTSDIVSGGPAISPPTSRFVRGRSGSSSPRSLSPAVPLPPSYPSLEASSPSYIPAGANSTSSPNNKNQQAAKILSATPIVSSSSLPSETESDASGGIEFLRSSKRSDSGEWNSRLLLMGLVSSSNNDGGSTSSNHSSRHSSPGSFRDGSKEIAVVPPSAASLLARSSTHERLSLSNAFEHTSIDTNKRIFDSSPRDDQQIALKSIGSATNFYHPNGDPINEKQMLRVRPTTSGGRRRTGDGGRISPRSEGEQVVMRRIEPESPSYRVSGSYDMEDFHQSKVASESEEGGAVDPEIAEIVDNFLEREEQQQQQASHSSTPRSRKEDEDDENKRSQRLQSSSATAAERRRSASPISQRGSIVRSQSAPSSSSSSSPAQQQQKIGLVIDDDIQSIHHQGSSSIESNARVNHDNNNISVAAAEESSEEISLQRRPRERRRVWSVTSLFQGEKKDGEASPVSGRDEHQHPSSVNEEEQPQRRYSDGEDKAAEQRSANKSNNSNNKNLQSLIDSDTPRASTPEVEIAPASKLFDSHPSSEAGGRRGRKGEENEADKGEGKPTFAFPQPTTGIMLKRSPYARVLAARRQDRNYRSPSSPVAPPAVLGRGWIAANVGNGDDQEDDDDDENDSLNDHFSEGSDYCNVSDLGDVNIESLSDVEEEQAGQRTPRIVHSSPLRR